jgi:hypothetical protein
MAIKADSDACRENPFHDLKQQLKGVTLDHEDEGETIKTDDY